VESTRDMNEYSEAWKKYRRLVIWWVVIFAAYVPVMLTGSILSQRFFKTDSEMPYLAGFWMCLWIASFLRISAFACPRCGKCFIGRWWFGNFSMRRSCAHCGLQRDPNALAVFPSRSNSR